MIEATWEPISTCPKTAGVPFIIRDAMQNVYLCEWHNGYWAEWLSGGFYGISPMREVTEWIPIVNIEKPYTETQT